MAALNAQDSSQPLPNLPLMEKQKTNRVAWALEMALLAGAAAAMAFARPVFAQGSFADVPAGHRACDAVNELASLGIFTGYPDGAFAGKRSLTRYEFAVAVQRLTQEPFRLDFVRPKPRERPRTDLPVLSRSFRDVPREHWASDAVDWLREKGIVAGYGDGTYRGHRSRPRSGKS